MDEKRKRPLASTVTVSGETKDQIHAYKRLVQERLGVDPSIASVVRRAVELGLEQMREEALK